MIKANHLYKTFQSGRDTVTAVDDISLHIQPGEFVSIMGNSGSGKTTLLHLLGGLEKPDSGQIVINGQSIEELSHEECTVFRRRNIGFVFQDYNLIPMLSVYDNIVFPLLLDGLQVEEAYLKELTHALNLDDLVDRMPSQLSGGQQQRAAIARALAPRPAVILADEPTGNLSSQNSLEVILLLQTVSKTYNQTVLMITHNDELAQMADRIIHIADGKIRGGNECEERKS